MPAKSNWVRVLLWGLLAYTAVHFCVAANLARKRNVGDFFTAFPTYWAWKINPSLIQENKSVIYWLGPEKIQVPDPKNPGTTIEVPNRTWNYGPVLHFATFPFIFAKNFAQAIHLWLLCCYGFLFVSLWVWYQLLFVDKKLNSWPVFVIYVGVWLNFSPLYEAVIQKNIEILEMMFISLAFFFASRKRDTAAGFWLGTAVMTKFLPAVFLPYLILKRRWRFLGSALMTMAAIGLLAQLTLGWENNYTMIFALGDSAFNPNRFVTMENQAFSGLVYRLFTTANVWSMQEFHFDHLVISNPALASLLTKLLVLLLAGVYGILFLRRRRADIHPAEIAIILTLMISACKWNHPYYFIFLVIGFSVALQALVSKAKIEGSVNPVEISVLVIAYLAVGLFVPGVIYGKLFQLFSVNFYQAYMYLSVAAHGVLLLLAWLAFRYRKEVPTFVES